MALLSSIHFISPPVRLPAISRGAERPPKLIFCAKKQESPGHSGNRGRIWRRRKLTKKDDKLEYKMERIPFLEEQMRKIRDTGKLMTMDVEKLLLREDNRFDFVNEVAAEAKSYVENNRDESLQAWTRLSSRSANIVLKSVNQVHHKS
ncbi:hypothetical protein H6P81_013972 [Aristolochia fimbriata]|uniref:Uncharacterized protein n=1 Tax=Aristolochia fimbriata TaxID=158543 RepID=A0AAV7EGP2_ARIFI|nr:hypothetical protein H6P81_013972 [Aristolochia fimbriata]